MSNTPIFDTIGRASLWQTTNLRPQTTLTRQLRELEEDGFLCRTVYGEVPPRVEYRLSPLGESFAPLLHAMLRWSEDHLEELGGCAPQNTDENEDI